MLNTDQTTSTPPPAAPATKMPEVVAPPAKLARKLVPKNFQVDIEGYVTIIWSARMEEGDVFNDTLKPDYWSHVAQKVDPNKGRGGLIYLRNFDDSMFAVLIVRVASQTGLRVGVVQPPVYFGPQDKVESGKLTTRWNLGKRVHEVIRELDKTVIGPAHALKEDALAWIADHNRKMAG